MILSGTEGHVMYNANSYGKLMFAVDTEQYKLRTKVYPDLRDCTPVYFEVRDQDGLTIFDYGKRGDRISTEALCLIIATINDNIYS